VPFTCKALKLSRPNYRTEGKILEFLTQILLSTFLKLKMIFKSRKMVPKSMLHYFKSLKTTQTNAEGQNNLF